MNVLGVMTGTSLDGADWALMNYAEQIIASGHLDLPDSTRALARKSIDEQAQNPADWAQLGHQLAEVFADWVHQIAKDHVVNALCVHGQTVLHLPGVHSLQAIQAQKLAFLTGLPVVADLRGGDIAMGGQGAPLVPAYHRAMVDETDDCAVLNIGGIGNISFLGGEGELLGFDVGPGNVLLDSWTQKYLNKDFDDKGSWARGGQVNTDLLRVLRAEPYFEMPPPKSTGRELFNIAWVEQTIKTLGQRPSEQDVIRTLVELTAWAVSKHIAYCPRAPKHLWVCGGGAENDFLLERIGALCTLEPKSTGELGIAPNIVEAAAFAWMGQKRLSAQPIDLTQVTGAARPGLYGTIFSV